MSEWNVMSSDSSYKLVSIGYMYFIIIIVIIMLGLGDYCQTRDSWCTIVAVDTTVQYYSVFQGIEQIKNEVEDPGEPLIDGIYGHGRYTDLAIAGLISP